jgi:hypothetical protein
MMAFPPEAIASGWRAADAEDSALQPQDGQTITALSESMSPQHIGQVLPYTLMPSLVLQGRTGESI